MILSSFNLKLKVGPIKISEILSHTINYYEAEIIYAVFSYQLALFDRGAEPMISPRGAVHS